MYIQEVSNIVEDAFEGLGLDRFMGYVKISDRPDLSDLQCNGSMAAAKILKRSPKHIAEELREKLENHSFFEKITVDGPGFLNFKLSDTFIIDRLLKLQSISENKKQQKILIDYGGPNVAKPLHVGHLRSAIIGESLKRIAKTIGHDVISDIHLGDWGTPMGMLIAELKDRHPDWSYFHEDYFQTEETYQPPFDAETLNQLYPEAAKRFKEDKNFSDSARLATADLQMGHSGYIALWKHFVNLSVASIKNDFQALGVDFDLWLGESDADPYIENMIKDLLERGVARKSDGAIVIDVKRDGDNQEIPPLMLQKRDGAVTYATTDLATIFQRVADYNPDKILYVVDQRQSLHFLQVFRAAGLAGYIEESRLEHIGFGTMNGKDGKPFKTRAGGVMRLSDLIDMSKSETRRASGFTDEALDDDTKKMLDDIAVAAIKYGDLSNPRMSDYIFEPSEFVRFEGNTGPYIQYTAVRAQSILDKAKINRPLVLEANITFTSSYERNLALSLLDYQNYRQLAFERRMPSILCDYLHGLCRSFNGFYRNCPVAVGDNKDSRSLRLFLTQKTRTILEDSLNMLAIPVPHRMARADTFAP